MNINDIIALAKSGYKKKDIDELLKLELPEPAEPDPEPLPDTENGQKDGAEGDPVPEDDVPDIEYITLEYDKAQKEIADLKTKLQKAQQQNINRNIDPVKDERAERTRRITDYARNLM